MKDFVAKVKGFFLNSSVWLYAGFILFCAYYQMQVSRELGWGSMVGNFFLLTLIFISVLIFISLEEYRKAKVDTSLFLDFLDFFLHNSSMHFDSDNSIYQCFDYRI